MNSSGGPITSDGPAGLLTGGLLIAEPPAEFYVRFVIFPAKQEHSPGFVSPLELPRFSNGQPQPPEQNDETGEWMKSNDTGSQQQPQQGQGQEIVLRLCATSPAAAALWVGSIFRLLSRPACASLLGSAHLADADAGGIFDGPQHALGAFGGAGLCEEASGDPPATAAFLNAGGAATDGFGCTSADASWELLSVDDEATHA